MKTPQDLFPAELPIIRSTQTSLGSVLEKRSAEAARQVQGFGKVFMAGGRPRAGKCEAIILFLRPAAGAARGDKDGESINAALVRAAQRVAHYEIASYGCLRARAAELGNQTAAQLLQSRQDEEKSADRVLTEDNRARSNKPACGNGFWEGKRGHLRAEPRTSRFPRACGVRLARTGTRHAS